jgi:hypothetical protein
MSPVFRSGAFIQQCFSVHPLCLAIKKLALPEQMLISCSSCKLTHRLTLRRSEPSSRAPAEAKNGEWLSGCMEEHPTALGIGTLDVLQDAIGFRCLECRKSVAFEVTLFETHQRS